jgi:hypothetical protein
MKPRARDLLGAALLSVVLVVLVVWIVSVAAEGL